MGDHFKLEFVNEQRQLVSTKASQCHLYLAADGGPTLNVPVDSLSMASAAWQHYRDRYGFGASAMKRSCGSVYAPDGTLMACVSYNGRVWSPTNELLEEAP
jgi:hypothetical protein